jgi:molybdopterin molybdotransferase
MVSADDRSALRGPSRRARMEDVGAWIDAWAAPLAPEEATLADAAGRVLARDVQAPVDLPPFDRVATDGYALQADETVGAGVYSPLTLRLAPESAGAGARHAVAVQSGEPLPAGADAVARPEQTMPDAPGTVAVIATLCVGNEVERQASHAARGSVLVPAGRQLEPAEIGLAASAGIACVSVVARPRVRCLVAADRATEAGHALPPGAIHDANGPMLAALVARDGGVVVERRLMTGGAEGAGAALRDALVAPGADVVLVAGGTGAGANDRAAAALAEAGELAVHGVALRPGESAGAGRAAGIPVFLLPGTPPACLWAYELIAGRAIRRLAGRAPELPFPVRTMRTARKIVSEIGMVDVCPVRCTGEGEVEPVAPFAEAGLVSAAQADGFVLVPEASEGYRQGATVPVHLYTGHRTRSSWPRPPTA